MNIQTKILVAFAAGASAGLAMGCQTYDFEPVEPLSVTQDNDARVVVSTKRKPNIMILLDKSGSMNRPTDSTDPDCPASCGAPDKSNLCPEATCPTRISELRSAMSTFLGGDGGTVGRFGLTLFPQATDFTAQNGCKASSTVAIPITTSADVPSELTAQALAIRSAILQITAAAPLPTGTGGGTPTGGSIAFVGNEPSLNDPQRDDFVLLLTDGLPNCNPANNTCGTPTSCLDATATVQQIAALKAKDIKTIVVGFGADTAAGAAPTTLNAMAEAGGFARGCPDGGDAECGAGDTCQVANPTSASVCARKFFQAANAAELTLALQKIIDLIGPVKVCEIPLGTAPSDLDLLRVKIDGVNVPRGDTTWAYQTPTAAFEFGQVIFSEEGEQCTRLKTASEGNPVNLEITIVQKL